MNIKSTKIIQIIDNTHGYHQVSVDTATGEVWTAEAPFLALVHRVAFDGLEFQEVVPMEFCDGMFQPCDDCSDYLGTAAPGDDALKLASSMRFEYREKYNAWRESTGITELIVPGGGR